MEFEGYSSYEQQVADAVKEFTHLRALRCLLCMGIISGWQLKMMFSHICVHIWARLSLHSSTNLDSREISVSLPFGLEYNGSSTVSVTLEPYST